MCKHSINPWTGENEWLVLNPRPWNHEFSVCSTHRFERITRYNLGLASIGNSLETVRSYANNSYI